jgi:hypothetical protein
MHTTRPRRAAAVLVLLSLLCAAVPAAATPVRATDEASIGAPLLQALAAWLARVWPAPGPTRTPERTGEALGSALDPGGAPQDTSGEPTALPQLGSGADPDG